MAALTRKVRVAQQVTPDTMSTTPKKITKRIRKFLNTLGQVGDPVYLPLSHINYKYLANHCLSNCEAESHFTGDPIIYGWVIWEDKKSRFIEAEFHAVIYRNRKFVDITPRVDDEELILFVPDKIRVAKRIDKRKWDTWENHKSHDGTIERTKSCIKTNTYDDRLF